MNAALNLILLIGGGGIILGVGFGLGCFCRINRPVLQTGRKRVYVAHPYQGKPENVEKVKGISRAIAAEGYLPVSPIHTFGFLDDSIPEERELALEFCKELISACHEVWVFGDYKNSVGVQTEIKIALQENISIRFN